MLSFWDKVNKPGVFFFLTWRSSGLGGWKKCGLHNLLDCNTRSLHRIKYAPLEMSTRLVPAPPTRHSIHPHGLTRCVIHITNREGTLRSADGVVVAVVVWAQFTASLFPHSTVHLLLLQWSHIFSGIFLHPIAVSVCGACRRCGEEMRGNGTV